MATPEVIPFSAAHLQDAYRVICRAFYDYPMVEYVFPDKKSRDRSLAWYMGYTVRFSMKQGEIWTTSEMEGISAWVIPGSKVLSLKNHLKNGWLTGLFHLGVGASQRATSYDSFSKGVHHSVMPGEHAYLWLIAVDPDLQGRGVGSALLEPTLDRTDREGLPCYLETHIESNLPFYRSHGFEVVFEGQLPRTELSMWAMARQPKV